MSSRAYLRPPVALYQVFALLLAPLVVFGSLAIWARRLPELQRLYLRDYVKSSAPRLPSLHASVEQRQPVVLICYGAGKGQVPALDPLDWGRKPHAARFVMTRAQEGLWLRTYIYGGSTIFELLRLPLALGVLLCVALWTIAWHLDQERHLEFRRERVHVSGPRIVSRREFRKRVPQTGLGLWLERRTFWGRMKLRDEVVRVEREKEPQHFLFGADPGGGKTSAMMSLLDDCEARGYRAVCYDPHRQFVRRYWNAKRGDVILGLDNRGAGWNPCDEIDWSSEFTAMADWAALMESLYPGEPSLSGGNSFYFISTARDIGQYCGVNHRPNAQELAELYSRADPLLDHVVKGTPLEETLHKNTSGTRASIIGTLTTNIVPMLRQIRTPSAEHPGWSAREWSRTGKGWVFLTSTQGNRVTSGPLQRLWIDLIARNILSFGDEYPAKLPPTAIILDEMYALGMLMSVKMLVAELRKSGCLIAMGFQAKAQLKEWYGEYHEVLMSAPWHKVLGRVGDVDGQKLAAGMLGRRKVERVREHRGGRGERSWTTEEVEEFVVEPSELGSLENRHAYLRVKDCILPIQIAIPPHREPRCAGWIPRAGEPPKRLPMPNLDEIRAREEAERQRVAKEHSTVTIYRPERAPETKRAPEMKPKLVPNTKPAAKPKRGPNTKQEGLWNQQS